MLHARRLRLDPRLDLVAAFVIRFNLDLLPATTAPVMYNVEIERPARLFAQVRSNEVLEVTYA